MSRLAELERESGVRFEGHGPCLRYRETVDQHGNRRRYETARASPEIGPGPRTMRVWDAWAGWVERTCWDRTVTPAVWGEERLVSVTRPEPPIVPMEDLGKPYAWIGW